MIAGSENSKKLHSATSTAPSFLSLLPFIALLIAIIYWVPVIWLKYFTLHDYVFDSGVFYGSLQSIFYGHTEATIFQYAAGSTLRIILSPLSAFHSLLLLLYIQLLLVLGSSITVYFIGRRILSGYLAPVLLSCAFLLYFPLNGSIFFDVHAQTFFLPFILIAYYLEISGRYRSALVFFVLAGITRFPIIGLILIYSIADFIYNLRTLRKPAMRRTMTERLRFDTILFVVSFVITLLQYYSNTYLIGVSPLGNIHYVSGSTIFGGSLGTDLITVLIFTAPLLLLPLYYSEFSAILWALFGFAFYTNYSGYLYPSVFADQYSALFVPIIFISLFAGLFARNRDDSSSDSHLESSISTRRITPQMGTVLKIFIAVIVFAVLFQPYSPVSPHTNGSMDVGTYTTPGILNEAQLQSVINLIPASASGVIFGGNMPELMVHSPNVNGTLVSDTINGYPLSWTPAYFLYNSSIQYVLGDTAGMSTTPDLNAYNQYEITRNAMSSGQYGVIAEYHGAYLLGRGYTGTPLLYSPITYSPISYARMAVLNASYQIRDGLVMHNVSSASIIPAYSMILYPGTYSAVINLSGSNLTGTADLNLRLSAYDLSGNILLKNSSISEGQRSIRIVFSIDNFYSDANIFITNLTFTGTVSFSSISLQEIGG